MSDKNDILKTTEVLGISATVPAIYQDVLSPSARRIGKGLETVTQTVLISIAPLEAIVWSFERIKSWLVDKVARILEERKTSNIITPPLALAGPLVTQLVFASDEPDLREMYACLLATAMDGERPGYSHPSFVYLIQQLSPAEARILRYLATCGKTWPNWYESRHKPENVDQQMADSFRAAGLLDSDNFGLYTDNLVRLRILARGTVSDLRSPRYELDETSPVIETFETIELTEYGRALLNACVVNPTHEHDPFETHGKI